MRYRILTGLMVLTTTLAAASNSALGQGGAAKAKLSLVPSVDAVVPGEPFDLGIRFEIEDGWHIYWQNPGDSGLPPSMDWKLPAGFEVSEFKFPVPKKHLDPGDFVTNVIEGEPMLIVRVTPPANLTGEKVTIGGELGYLVCEKICIREDVPLSIDLPVRAASKPANEDLFKKARRRLPGDSSDYLIIKATVSKDPLRRGEEFELTLAVDIASGLHIQSNTPLAGLIACELWLNAVKGIEYDDASFPEPRKRQIQYLGEVSEFEGRIKIKIPGQMYDNAEVGPTRLAGLLRFQACTDKGTCFPPETIAFSMMTTVASAAGATPAVAAPVVETPPVEPVAPPETTAPPVPAGEVQSPEETAPIAGTEKPGAADAAEVGGFLSRFGLPGLLIACFFYGLSINATPCVLPLLSIKVLGFVQQAHESRSRTMALGFSFGIGVIIFFVILGFLAASGGNLLQSEWAVIGLGAVVLALALSMLGVFTLQVPATATMLEASIQKEGLFSSFGKGALAPVLGFACTAPFMAAAFGWATTQPQHIALLAFLFSGIGMASPYVLLGANPNWLSFLPKPGNWMITFERVMGFLLLVMVVYLISPLGGRIGPTGLQWTFVFYIAVALGCWLLGQVQHGMPVNVRWRYRGGAVALILFSGVGIYGWAYPLDKAPQLVLADARRVVMANSDGEVLSSDDWSLGIPWRRWSPAAVEAEVRAGHTVFVDFTADYCTSCKTNKKIATNTPDAIDKMKALGVIPFQADFSDSDEEIFEGMQAFLRAGPPLNLVYPAGRYDKPIVLPVLFTKNILLEKLDEAGPSVDISGVSAKISGQE